MSTCLSPIILKALTCKENVFIKYIPTINIYCNINKNKIVDIIKYTLLESCNLSMFGYNNRTDEFWGKKIKNNNYLIHFTLEIKYIDNNNSFIVISPFIGDNNEIIKIVSNINQIISLHNPKYYI
jgi:hypothetical protein